MKSEEPFETGYDVSPPAQHAEPVRRRIVSLPKREQKANDDYVSSRLPLPMMRKQVRELENRIRNEEDTILDSISRRIETLKQEIDSTDELNGDIAVLENIDQQLELLLQQRQETSIVDELARLQSLNTKLVNPKKAPNALKIIGIGTAAIILLCGVSLVMSNLAYDYCYYFC